jgi:hypothetical protein
LAIAAIVLLAYLSPGSAGPSQPTREVHGWAAVALLLLVIAASILTALGLLFLVAYLGGALRGERSGVRDALGVTRRMLLPGLAGFVVTWAAVVPTSMVAAAVALALLPLGTVEDASLPQLLWHTRAWQLDGSERPTRPPVPGRHAGGQQRRALRERPASAGASPPDSKPHGRLRTRPSWAGGGYNGVDEVADWHRCPL